FRQRLSADGRQIEERVAWKPEDYLERLPQRVSVTLAGRTVEIAAWRFEVAGVESEPDGAHAEHPVWTGGRAGGAPPPRNTGVGWRQPRAGSAGGASRRAGAVVLLLDTNLPENAAEDRSITDRLYLGDQRCRLMQEAVLGIGGVRML